MMSIILTSVIFMIGIVVFTVKLVLLACKAAWGVTAGLLFAVGIPLWLVVLFAAGLLSLALPVLFFSLLAVFLWPAFK